MVQHFETLESSDGEAIAPICANCMQGYSIGVGRVTLLLFRSKILFAVDRTCRYGFVLSWYRTLCLCNGLPKILSNGAEIRLHREHCIDIYPFV